MRILTHVRLPAIERLPETLPDVALVTVPPAGPLDADVHGDVLLTLPWSTPSLADVLARGVRWVHVFGTGVDAFPLDRLRGRVLTCSRGASAVPIAEWVLATMLAFEKQLPAAWVTAPPPQWSQAALGTLAGRVLGLVGIGAIGQAIASRARAFDMTLRAVRRTAAPSPVPGLTLVGSLEALAGEADHLVVAAPATPATRRLVDACVLGAAKPGLHLVNVARGTLVDQDALQAALDAGRIACASLDVADPEPLPAGHWLYAHPRVRLSPHVSWSAPDAFDRLVAPFVRNVHRWRRGEPLEGVVDVAAGY